MSHFFGFVIVCLPQAGSFTKHAKGDLVECAVRGLCIDMNNCSSENADEIIKKITEAYESCKEKNVSTLCIEDILIDDYTMTIFNRILELVPDSITTICLDFCTPNDFESLEPFAFSLPKHIKQFELKYDYAKTFTKYFTKVIDNLPICLETLVIPIFMGTENMPPCLRNLIVYHNTECSEKEIFELIPSLKDLYLDHVRHSRT